uniref:Protein CASC3 n=1 Tax=Dermatophagoides pteronyssinus TaxID=6956 RepID=A0A6P6XXM4_DERPT|nr:probable serine/threonine-protein kinase DDB_G0282963 isoform X2 [Dermatophagoides pteronyssinus]
MNDDPISSAVMENSTISNQSSIDNSQIDVIEGEEIQSSTLFEQSSAVVKKNDGHYSNINDSDNSDNESEPELRNTSTSNAGESEYESANEEELLFQNNNFNDNDDANLEQHQQQSLSDGKIDEKSNESIIHNNDDKDEISNCYYDNSYALQKEYDDDDNDVEEEEELTDNIGEDEMCDNVDEEEEEDDESVRDDKHNIIDNCQDTNNNENPRECGDGEESIPSKNKTIQPMLDEENVNLNDNTNKECMINTTNATQPKSLPKSAKLSKAELLKAKRNPQYIPRKGSYFEHDDRGNDEDGTKNKENDEPLNVIGEEHEMNDSVNDQNVKTTSAIGKKSMLSSMKLCSDDMNDSVYDHQSQKSDQDQQEGKSLHEKTNILESSSKTTMAAQLVNKKKSIWDSGEKWHHDKFNVDDQKPKTREELIEIYGYDIRTETEAPRLNRRSKYGKGPQRYSRRSDDENAYAKKTLHKVIMKSRSSNAVGTSSKLSSNKNDHHTSNNLSNNSFQKQSSLPNTINKRDRVFDRTSNNDHSSLNNSRKSHQSKSTDVSPNAKILLSYRNSNISGNSHHHHHHQHNDNSSPRIFENDRIFTNKSGGNRSYSNNINNNIEKPILKASTPSNKSNDESGSDLITQKVKSLTTDISVADQKDNNNNNQSGNPMFTNEDFPALMSTSKNDAPANQMSDQSIPQESVNKNTATATNNESKVIYYQVPNSSNETNQTNEDSHSESVQTATLSESNIGSHSLQEYSQQYRQQQQPSNNLSSTTTAVESLQFENSRYSHSRNNKVTSHYYNSSNQSWNNHRQQSSKSHHHIYNHNNSTTNNRKYNNNNNNESNVMVHHHEATINASNNNDDSMIKRYSSLRQQQQRNLTSNAGTVSNVSQPHQSEINNAPQYIETDTTTVKNAIYYEPSAATIGVEPTAAGNFTSTATGSSISQQQQNHHHHPHHGHHNYVSSINGSPASVTVGGPNVVATSAAAPATATAFIPPAASTLMAYYPNSGQSTGPGTTTATGPLNLSQTHFYAADQSQAAANYYLSAATVAYHPAAAPYLPTTATYPPTLAAAATHHTPHPHQSHVTTRFMNTTASATGTAESDRYLQTRPPVTAQNSASILMTAGGQTGYPTVAAIAAAFPSGYPQFPPQPTATTGQQSSPLPAGYPNVQIGGNTGSTGPPISGSGSTAAALTPSGYPESYRDGITYYDIRSQQQAMQRIQQQQSNINNNTQSQSTTSSASNRRCIVGGGGKISASTNKIHESDQANSNLKSTDETKSSSASNNTNNNELSVNN